MIRVADYIFHFLADAGVRHVFLVTGGGAMFLNDGLRLESRITPVCCHHEQACTIAAEGYARLAAMPGVASVTTGPGGINALNGVFGAWTDSIPMLVISGQVKRETCMASYPQHTLRQLGDQETDIISMASGITKYAVLVDDPQMIRYHLEQAWSLAQSGRPGPCWLDVPLDVQSALIDPDALPGYTPAANEGMPHEEVAEHCSAILEKLVTAQRPLILAGHGIASANVQPLFRQVVDRLGVPVALSRTACDLLPLAHPYYAGRSGIDADRAGNISVQTADLLLILASRLNTRQTGYNWHDYARNAERIWVNIDGDEMQKPTVGIDLALPCDIGVFLREMQAQLAASPLPRTAPSDWLASCRARVARFHGEAAQQDTEITHPMDPYAFLRVALGLLDEDDVIVCGNGAAFIMVAQTAALHGRQRLFFNSGCASMGYDLPAAVGAAFAHGKRVICFAGDGSLMMNLQELQTVAHHQLPIKIFILNNNGYLSIRTTQQGYFEGKIGESPESGVSFPDFVQMGQAFGIPSCHLTGEEAHLEHAIARLLDTSGPVLCNVIVDQKKSFEPRASSKVLPDGRMASAALEDMYPFLEQRELEQWCASVLECTTEQ